NQLFQFLESADPPLPPCEPSSYLLSLGNVQQERNIWEHRFPWKRQQPQLCSQRQPTETRRPSLGGRREPLLGSLRGWEPPLPSALSLQAALFHLLTPPPTPQPSFIAVGTRRTARSFPGFFPHPPPPLGPATHHPPLHDHQNVSAVFVHSSGVAGGAAAEQARDGHRLVWGPKTEREKGVKAKVVESRFLLSRRGLRPRETRNCVSRRMVKKTTRDGDRDAHNCPKLDSVFIPCA
uniref:Uncharacterized protein n=1 Tax=Mustela putorius furo TaxID=9669 RepID=M3YIM4_MUSPF